MIYPKIWSSSCYKRDLLRKVGVRKKSKNRLNRGNWKKKSNREKKPIKPIKILKKITGSVSVL
jgi:hypothetical protein